MKLFSNISLSFSSSFSFASLFLSLSFFHVSAPASPAQNFCSAASFDSSKHSTRVSSKHRSIFNLRCLSELLPCSVSYFSTSVNLSLLASRSSLQPITRLCACSQLAFGFGLLRNKIPVVQRWNNTKLIQLLAVPLHINLQCTLKPTVCYHLAISGTYI